MQHYSFTFTAGQEWWSMKHTVISFIAWQFLLFDMRSLWSVHYWFTSTRWLYIFIIRPENQRKSTNCISTAVREIANGWSHNNFSSMDLKSFCWLRLAVCAYYRMSMWGLHIWCSNTLSVSSPAVSRLARVVATMTVTKLHDNVIGLRRLWSDVLMFRPSLTFCVTAPLSINHYQMYPSSPTPINRPNVI